MELFFKTGIILLLSIPLGHLAVRFKLPRILGYIFGGILLGPYFLNIIDESFLDKIEPFYIFALSYILFLVGAKIKIKRMLGFVKPVIYALIFQGILSLIFMFFLGFFITNNFILSILFSLIALSKAPATAMAVISEYEAEGDFSGSILLYMILNDIFIIFTFYIFWPFLKSSNTFFIQSILISVLKFLGSIILGVLSGFILSYLEAKAETDINLTFPAIGLILFLFGLLEFFKMSPYIGAVFFGFVVSNSSIKHKRVLKNLEFFDNLIYVLFFFLAGAGMHLELIIKMLPFVLLYILIRTISVYSGTYFGSLKGGFEKEDAKNFALSVLPQAGLTIGFAILLSTTGIEHAVSLKNTILASVVFFETIGVIFLRKALISRGEVKIFHVIEKEIEPIFDFHFDRILKTFLKEVGVYSEKSKLKEPKVKHIMTSLPLVIKYSDNLEKVIDSFERAKCDLLPVVDEENNYLGSIVIYDLEELVVDKTLKRLLLAQDLVRENLKCLNPDDELEKAREVFKELNVSVLPVIKDKKIHGVVLRRDLIKFA